MLNFWCKKRPELLNSSLDNLTYSIGISNILCITALRILLTSPKDLLQDVLPD